APIGTTRRAIGARRATTSRLPRARRRRHAGCEIRGSAIRASARVEFPPRRTPMERRMNALTAAACLLLVGVATAQDAPKSADPSGSATDRTSSGDDELQGRVCRCTKMIGMNVKNAKGEKIGEVDDLVVDKGEGVVAYGVLSFGGFLGIGEKLFAIPYGNLKRSG